MDKNKILIISISILFFMPFLGKVHLFDWDEINFAEISREMVVTGEYLQPQINYQDFTEKPPMFMWMQAGAMHIFGINAYAARFPNTLAGLITLLLLYFLGKKFYNSSFGLLWAGCYFGSILPHLYFRSGIIDPWFNLFIFLSLLHIFLFSWRKSPHREIPFYRGKWYYLFIAGVFTGLAILMKGPVAFLIIFITLAAYWITNKCIFYISIIEFSIYTLTSILTASIWFGAVTLFNGPQFVIEFTLRQWALFSQPDAGHVGFLGYHFIVLLLGVFPASIFMIRSMGKTFYSHSYQKDMKRWMLILFWVVLILFSLVSTKIVHYSSLAYYPISYLSALVIYQINRGLISFSSWMKVSLIAIAFIFGGLVIFLPWLSEHLYILKKLLAADPFAVANLNAEVQWTVLDSIPGVWLIIITLIGVIYFNKKKIYMGAIWLFGGTGVFVFLTLSLIITKVEAITQNAAISFYKTKVDCDCYVVPEEYKSYAHLFYTQISPGLNPKRYDMNWLKTGDIDKDVYFVAKINGTQHLEELNDVSKVYEKNGFTFWKRKAKK